MPSHVWQQLLVLLLLLLFLLLPVSQATWGSRQVPGGDVPEASRAEEEPSRVIFDEDVDLGSRVALGLLAPVLAGLVMLVLLTLFAERGSHHHHHHSAHSAHTAYAAAPYHRHGESSTYSVLRHFDEDATRKFL